VTELWLSYDWPKIFEEPTTEIYWLLNKYSFRFLEFFKICIVQKHCFETEVFIILLFLQKCPILRITQQHRCLSFFSVISSARV
jgi:hypothetical protein